MSLTLIVEGGGESREVQQALKRGIALLVKNALPPGAPKPAVSPEADRTRAFKVFRGMIERGKSALLLVDSEDVVSPGHGPWEHVAARGGDQWKRPTGASDEDLHFMAATMEAWLAADPDALADYFGQGFKPAKLPQALDIETVPKRPTLYDALESATRATTKPWSEKHTKAMGWELIGKIDPAKVEARARRFAPRFFAELRKRMGATS